MQKSFLSSFKNAFAGLRHCLKTQRNFRIQLALAVLVLAFGSLLGLSRLEWLVLVFAVFLVLVAEMLNTVFESIVDIVAPKWKEKAKIAKDVGAGAVLMAALSAVIIGVIVFGPLLF